MYSFISVFNMKIRQRFDQRMPFSREAGYDPTHERVWAVIYLDDAGCVKTRKDLIDGDVYSVARFLKCGTNDKMVLSFDDYGIITYSNGKIYKHKLSEKNLKKLMECLDECD